MEITPNLDSFSKVYNSGKNYLVYTRLAADLDTTVSLMLKLTEAKKNSSFDDDIYDSCSNAWRKAEEIRLEIITKRKDQKCASMRAQIENSRGQTAGSDTANFLMGMLNAYMEDEACD